MEKVKVALNSGRAYSVLVGQKIASGIGDYVDLARYSKLFVITDENLKDLWLKKIIKALPADVVSIVLPPGEDSKSYAGVGSIWLKLKEGGADRRSLILNLGGGVICDLGGFAASTYMRGIDFVHVPTTLLSQVDAAIGGKTGFNFGQTKNLIGTFAQPKCVIADVETLSTLKERVFRSGFAEVIKHGLIADYSYAEEAAAGAPSNPKDFPFLCEIVKRSCEIKRDVVCRDEKEGGFRKVLNFGHTVGHAIEALSFHCDEPLLHGEAVAIGMAAEAKLSALAGMISKEEAFKINSLIQSCSLPVKLKEKMDFEELLLKIKGDKKNYKEKINWTLLKNPGEAAYDCQVEDELVIEAISSIMP